jgi:coenzyme F420-0:L-glutamate ligase
MIITPKKTKIFQLRDNLFDFIVREIPKLREQSIIVVTSKIVALSQGRVVPIRGTDKKLLVQKESKRVIQTPWCLLGYRDGEWSANAGIDESNARDNFILLPKNPMKTAKELWLRLRKRYGIPLLGIIITDTRTIPLKKGTCGVAIGYAGFDGLKSYIGKKDMFSRTLRMTRVNAADSLACSAVFAMGEGNEQTPLAVIRKAPIAFWKKNQQATHLRIDSKKDIYAAIFQK